MDFSARAAVFRRSFLMQALWSPAGMQNLGLLYALEPALDQVHPSLDERRDARMRHLSFFNTNPYMAGFVLGFVARLEEASDHSRVESLKKAIGAAFGAVGDASIWGALQPACAAVAAFSAVVAWSLNIPGAALACAALYLILFNVPTLWLRWRGIALGYDLGEQLPAALAEWHWQRKAKWLRRAGLLFALAGPLYLIAREAGFVGWRAALPAAAIAAAVWLRSKGFSSIALYGLCLAGAAGWRAALGLG